MPPTPDETLRTLGTTMRNARIARGLTQQRVSQLARVSRSQVASFEKGGNVSLRFFLKLAAHFELPVFASLAESSSAGEARAANTNAFEMIRTLELLAALVDYMRELSVDVVLPPSSRETLRDTPALKDFLERHAATNADGFARLEEALFRFSGERPAPHPAAPERAAAAPRRRSGRVR